MKEKVKSVQDDMLLELFKTTLTYTMDADKHYLEMLRVQIEYLQEMIKLKYHDEPWKILKYAHKKWEDEIDELEMDLCHAYENLGKEFFEQQEFYEKLKGSNKKAKKEAIKKAQD